MSDQIEIKKTEATNSVSDLTPLFVDPDRLGLPPCGVVVRAQLKQRWVTADVAALGRRSLLRWLRSRGGRSPWAEDFVGYLLGHGALTNAAGEPLDATDAPGNTAERPS